MPEDIETKEKGMCNVCCEEEFLYRNICGHDFCLTCWLDHITMNVNGGTLFLKCMTCTTPLLYETMMELLGVKEKDQACTKLKSRYEKKLC